MLKLVLLVGKKASCLSPPRYPGAWCACLVSVFTGNRPLNNWRCYSSVLRGSISTWVHRYSRVGCKHGEKALYELSI